MTRLEELSTDDLVQFVKQKENQEFVDKEMEEAMRILDSRNEIKKQPLVKKSKTTGFNQSKRAEMQILVLPFIIGVGMLTLIISLNSAVLFESQGAATIFNIAFFLITRLIFVTYTLNLTDRFLLNSTWWGIGAFLFGSHVLLILNLVVWYNQLNDTGEIKKDPIV